MTFQELELEIESNFNRFAAENKRMAGFTAILTALYLTALLLLI